MDVCVSACLGRELERMSSQSVDGQSGVGQDTWTTMRMKCSYCLKFTGRYAVCTVVRLQETDTKREGVKRRAAERKRSAYCKHKDVRPHWGL